MLHNIDNFIDSLSASQTTRDGYRYLLIRFDRWLTDENKNPAVLSSKDLLGFIDSTGWGNALRSKSCTVIKLFLKWVYGSSHPALILRIKREESPPQRSLTFDQVYKLLTSLNTTSAIGIRNLAIVTLTLETGLRKAELCNLQFDKVDLKTNILNARVKGGYWRFAYFSDYTASCLASWAGVRTDHVLPDCKAFFCSVGGLTPGKQLTPDGMTMIFSSMGRKSGIGAFSPHDLRRTMATLSTRSGAPTRLVQEAGGWKDIRLVERYTRSLTAVDFIQYSPVTKSLGI